MKTLPSGDLADLVPSSTTFLGWPLTWFEVCDIRDRDGCIRDGKLYLDGGGDVYIRMKDKYRHRAGW